MITKTSYLTFTRCAKAVWLDANRPDLAASLDPSVQRRLATGQAVDKLAREQFPNGRLIPYRPRPEEMAPLTAQAMAEGTETLFQATFHEDDLLVKVDILTRLPNGWHLIEVKSSTRYKAEDHLPDVAFQVFVLQQAGIPVAQASLMHLNRECRYPGLSNLFAFTDLTQEVAGFLPQVAQDVTAMRPVDAPNAEVPEVEIGRFCLKPDQCAYYAHCWQATEIPTIYHIPYLKRPQEEELEAQGVQRVRDVPTTFAFGDRRAAVFVETVRQQKVTIDHDAIRAALDKLVYPLYFFDFETIDYAVPTFDGCKPFQQVPFQYSCHILQADGTLTHCDYLHRTADDPRQALVAALLNHIGETGHLIAFNIPFERGVLQHLAEQFPRQADRLQAMAARLWDQLAIFRNHYHDYRFGGSNSLKSVLPVVVPALSYETLPVQNGTQAQVVWEQMIAERDTAVKEQLIQQLREYCQLDTLAMVKIHEALQNYR